MQYSSPMHRILFAGLLLAGCSTAPPRPLPSADWAKGAAAFVQQPTTLLGYFGSQADENPPALLKAGVEANLRSAGLRVIDRQEDKGEVQVLIGDLDNDRLVIPVQIARDGETLDRMDLKPFDLPCWSAFRTQAMQCVAREIAARALESPKVAAAMRRQPPRARMAATPARALSGKLAVLELRNFTKDLTKENAQYFTDVVRSAALKARPQLEVMTRENLLVLLQASGKDLASCEGECEVDTGRRIGADQIVSGEIQKLGSLYKLSLRLHDTHEGRLLASTQASGKTIEELDQAAQQAAADLLK